MGKGRRIEYRSFEEAKIFCRALNLRNKDEWTRYAKGEFVDREPKPKNIPSRVDKIYKETGWSGFDDFLGTKKAKELKKNFKNFEQARAFARNLRLATKEQWQGYATSTSESKSKLPVDIPINPEEVYKSKGWVNFTDFLSDHYQPIVIKKLSFEDARAFAHSLNLKSIQDWELYRNGGHKELGLEACPKEVPVWPPHAYKKSGWAGWANWLNLSFSRTI